MSDKILNKVTALSTLARRACTAHTQINMPIAQRKAHLEEFAAAANPFVIRELMDALRAALEAPEECGDPKTPKTVSLPEPTGLSEIKPCGREMASVPVQDNNPFSKLGHDSRGFSGKKEILRLMWKIYGTMPPGKIVGFGPLTTFNGIAALANSGFSANMQYATREEYDAYVAQKERNANRAGEILAHLQAIQDQELLIRHYEFENMPIPSDATNAMKALITTIDEQDYPIELDGTQWRITEDGAW